MAQGTGIPHTVADREARLARRVQDLKGETTFKGKSFAGLHEATVHAHFGSASVVVRTPAHIGVEERLPSVTMASTH